MESVAGTRDQPTAEPGLLWKPSKPQIPTSSSDRHRARSIQMVTPHVMRKWTSAEYSGRVSTQILDGLVQVDSPDLYIIKTSKGQLYKFLASAVMGNTPPCKVTYSILQQLKKSDRSSLWGRRCRSSCSCIHWSYHLHRWSLVFLSYNRPSNI